MIELPAIDLCARSGQDSALSASDDTSQTPPISCAVHGGRRRARFSREEDHLLVKLKARREPKLSWRVIQGYFPNRTSASLQVHYSTQLKGHRASQRRGYSLS